MSLLRKRPEIVGPSICPMAEVFDDIFHSRRLVMILVGVSTTLSDPLECGRNTTAPANRSTARETASAAARLWHAAGPRPAADFGAFDAVSGTLRRAARKVRVRSRVSVVRLRHLTK